MEEFISLKDQIRQLNKRIDHLEELIKDPTKLFEYYTRSNLTEWLELYGEFLFKDYLKKYVKKNMKKIRKWCKK